MPTPPKPTIVVDAIGNVIPAHDVSGMSHPVQCRWCGHVHDGGKVTVTARYADCDVWNCPGCGTGIDNRPIGWGGSAIPIDRDTGQAKW